MLENEHNRGSQRVTPENFFLLHHKEIKIKTKWSCDGEGNLSLPASPSCTALKAAPWNCFEINLEALKGRSIVVPTILGLRMKGCSVLSLQTLQISKCILLYVEEILHS